MRFIRNVLLLTFSLGVVVLFAMTISRSASSSSDIKIFPTDDTTVKENNKDRNYAADELLTVDGDPDRKVFLKFDLTGVDATKVRSASLVFFPELVHTSGQDIFQVESNSWSESEITYNERPPLGSKIAIIEGLEENQEASVDLTTFVKENIGKVVSIAIENSNNKKQIQFRSKEHQQEGVHLLLSGSEISNDQGLAESPTPDSDNDTGNGSSSNGPSVEFTSPEDGANVTGRVLVNVNATDKNSIKYVIFYLDGAKLTSDTSAPYEFLWNSHNSVDGEHLIRAEAYNSNHQVSTAELSVESTNGVSPDSERGKILTDSPAGDQTHPEVSITSPKNNQEISKIVSIEAEASDNVEVAKVEFFVDDNILSTSTSKPYYYTWINDGNPGGYTIKVRATDTAGNAAVAYASVYIPDDSPPVPVPTPTPDATPTPTGNPTPDPTGNPTPTPDATPTPTDSGNPLPPAPPPVPVGNVQGVWLSQDEIRSLPIAGESGCDSKCSKAWNELMDAANKPYNSITKPNLSNQDESTGHFVLAKAYAFVKTGQASYRNDVIQLLRDAVNTDQGGRSLAIGRKLPEYVIAADIINLSIQDPTFNNSVFVPWLNNLLTKVNTEGKSLETCNQIRPNNWGTHCGAARTATALYLLEHSNNSAIKQRAQNHYNDAVRVTKGWMGDTNAYDSFSYGDLGWQCNKFAPVGINPKDCRSSEGHLIDGVLPDDQRRTGSSSWPPSYTNYAYGGQEGSTVTATMMSRKGDDAWNWSDRASYRAVAWMYYNGEGKTKWDTCNDLNKKYVLDLVDKAYNSNFIDNMSCSAKDSPAQPGRNMAWTSWSHHK